MVTKPPGDWAREDRGVTAARQVGGVTLKALSAGASGIKRAQAAFRAVMSGMVALASAWAALAAGLSGLNIPMALLAAGCSLLMGWVALYNMRVAVGHPPSNVEKAEVISTQHRWASADGLARDSTINARYGASTISYSRNKLIMRTISTFATCALLVWMLTASMHRSLPMALIATPILGFYLWRVFGLVLRFTDKDLTAIVWDDRQIRVRTLSSTRQVPWQSVESVKSIRRVYRAYSIIPISKSYEMVFRLHHNGARHKMKIPAGDLTISPVEADQLVQLAFRRAQVANQNVKVNDAPDFSSTSTAANPDAIFVPGAADRARAFGAYDQTTAAPRPFGRKVM